MHASFSSDLGGARRTPGIRHRMAEFFESHNYHTAVIIFVLLDLGCVLTDLGIELVCVTFPTP